MPPSHIGQERREEPLGHEVDELLACRRGRRRTRRSRTAAGRRTWDGAPGAARSCSRACRAASSSARNPAGPTRGSRSRAGGRGSSANRATRSDSALSFGTSAGRWNRNAVFTAADGSDDLQRAGARRSRPGTSRTSAARPRSSGRSGQSISCPRSASARIAFSDAVLPLRRARGRCRTRSAAGPAERSRTASRRAASTPRGRSGA